MWDALEISLRSALSGALLGQKLQSKRWMNSPAIGSGTCGELVWASPSQNSLTGASALPINPTVVRITGPIRRGEQPLTSWRPMPGAPIG